MNPAKVAILGAGIGGLAAAVDLAARGVEVEVLERAATPGGKMREVTLGDARLDAGPTVFTLRQVFEDLFADAGESLSACVSLRKLEVLARHAWGPGQRLDLFADLAHSAQAIGEFAGAAEARRFLRFSEESRRTYEMLRLPYLQSQRPNPVGLTRALAADRLSNLWNLKPFTDLWRALGRHFRDQRLQQLFGRYATYCGSSPFLAPATLMLIAHVERDGVWSVDGGMHRLAVALRELAERRGARFRFGVEVTGIDLRQGRVRGLQLAQGDFVAADAVIVNADPAAVAAGLFGADARRATAAQPPSRRSLSALTWNLVTTTSGFPLVRHNVFFSADYAAEFADLFQRQRLPAAPTVYVCAQDRADLDNPEPGAPERLLCLINAPATGDQFPLSAAEIATCQARTFQLLNQCGLQLAATSQTRITTPTDFHQMFPATGGALYGAATHGWRASFQRPRSRTSIPGLYLAGGGTHPGAGVPMAALSGRLAAQSLLMDHASTHRFRGMATPGGTWTRSAMTAAKR